VATCTPADAVTGATTAILTGPDADFGPRFSLDGSRIAFERRLVGGSQIYVMGSDGRGLKLLTPEPISLQARDFGRGWETYEFSPDGKSLLISTKTSGIAGMTIAKVDGSGMRHLEVGMVATEPSFRPPDGEEILFITDEGVVRGLYTVNLTDGHLRQVLRAPGGYNLAGASWSPDGKHIAYWSWDEESAVEGTTAKTHVVAADGTGDIVLPMPADAVWSAHATWSNDGTRLFIARGHTPGMDDVRGVVLPADGSSVGTVVAPAGSVETECCAAWMWSPDDSRLLGRPSAGVGTRQQVVIDVKTGRVQPVPWSSTSDPTWQRVGQ
jgi:hypothetical protein